MAEPLNPDETVDFEELLIANMVELQTIAQLLIEKGIFSEPEYLNKLKLVNAEYQDRTRDH
jgi:hypothetical protein